jgi:hypothetical protein
MAYGFGNLIGDLARTNGSVLVKILGGYVIDRNLPGTDFGNFRTGYIFNTVDYVRFEKLSFVDELFHALSQSASALSGRL